MRNWAEVVWWPGYIGNDIRLKMTFNWEASSPGFQSSEQLDMVSRGSPGEYSMIDRFLGDTFRVLSCPFWSTVLLCRCRQRCPFSNWRCVWVWHCSSSICGTTVHATCIQDQVKPDSPSQCSSTCAVCASSGYSRCSGRTSVYSCASSLQNLSVPQDLYFSLSVPVDRSCWSSMVWLASFKSRANAFLLS